jgi:hypothetical protein
METKAIAATKTKMCAKLGSASKSISAFHVRESDLHAFSSLLIIAKLSWHGCDNIPDYKIMNLSSK